MQLSMKDKILEAAERRVRGAGFADMSFRDLAHDVGIKSASVHYHFPTKFDLGEALVEKYTEDFEEKLKGLDTSDLESALNGYADLNGKALVLGETICLCAVLGAEAIGLPAQVNEKTKAFFAMNIAWLESLFQAHRSDPMPETAAMIVAALEGAMIMASASRDRDLFDRIAGAVICSAIEQ